MRPVRSGLPPPPGINYLILMIFVLSQVSEFVRKFRDFAVPLLCGILCRDEFVRHLTRWPHASLVCGIWWYGRLSPGNLIRGRRARRTTRDAIEGMLAPRVRRLPMS